MEEEKMKIAANCVKISSIKPFRAISRRVKVVLTLGVFIALFTIPNILTFKFNQTCNPDIRNEDTCPSVADSSLFASGGELIEIGQSLNLTHYANRTDSNVSLAFANGSWDTHDILLGENWQGQSLVANVTALTDERNWINGSFDWDEKDDGSYNRTENDTIEILNPFQNWTFEAQDAKHTSGFYINNMSGNFLNTSNPSTGRNALELLIEGNLNDTGSLGYGYDENDYCQWTSPFNISRGSVYDATLKFQVKANKTMEMSMFQLRFYFDGVLFHSMYPAHLLSYGPGWHDFTIPLSGWINISSVFPTEMYKTTHNITIRLEYTSGWGTHYDFPNRQCQQIFISNLEFILQADVNPEQINLTMNDVPVLSSQYGKGNVTQYQNWIGSAIMANFTSVNNASYNVNLIADLYANATKTIPTTNSEPNSDAVGTICKVKNNSASIWEFYGYVSVPGGYEETNLTIEHPQDWLIMWVSSPQAPNINRISDCIRSLATLSIPVKEIAGGQNPTGFWNISGITPNYVLRAATNRNTTMVPGSGDWIDSGTFFAGDYLNVTAQINTTAAFTDVIGTQARLDFIFPNGTLWSKRSALAPVDFLGFVQFDPFQIPASGGDYVAGDYQVFVTWNNSKAGFPVNETGLYLTTFRVVHPARLVPKVSSIENFVEGTTTVLKVQFMDEVTGRAIQGASLSFTNLTGGLQTFQEDPSGFYMAELMASSSAIGENTITIIANHQYFETQSIPLTVIVVPRPSEIQWWLIILFAAVVTGILIAFVAYQRVYRYPKLVRDIRAVKRSIGRGERASMPVKPMTVLLAQEYQSQLKEGQGMAKHVSVDALFTTCQQEVSQGKVVRPAPSFEKLTPQTARSDALGERPPVGSSTQESTSQKARLDQLKNMITQVEDYKKRVAENEALKKQIAESEKRLHDVEKTAIPTDQLRNKIQDLEQKVNIQKSPLRQLQEENQQQEALQAAANRLPELQAKVKTLEQELAQVKQAKAETPAPADLPHLVQELQQKLNQTQLALRNRQARIKDLETQLGQTQGPAAGKP